MRVLALESSCDESAAAVLDARAGLLAHELFSQVELHRAYGGVVPELASRDHVRRLLPLVRGALERAGTWPAPQHPGAPTAAQDAHTVAPPLCPKAETPSRRADLAYRLRHWRPRYLRRARPAAPVP